MLLSPNLNLDQFGSVRQLDRRRREVKPNGLFDVLPGFNLRNSGTGTTRQLWADSGIGTSLRIKLDDHSERHAVIIHG